jgi:hypothetical protein
VRAWSLTLTVLITASVLTGFADSASALNDWKKFPRPSFPSAVEAATIHEGQLIVGGYFTSIHDVPARHVARWNGFGWEALGAGAASRVTALASYNGELYNGNAFSEGAVARLDGSGWYRVGTFLISSGLVYIDAMIEFGGFLIVAGLFDEVDGSPHSGFAVYDGSSWSSLAGGPAGPGQRVTSLCIWQGDLVAAGDFTVAGGGVADRIARWTGTSWVPIGAGLPDAAESMLEFDGELWAGFWSSVAGSEVRRWDGVNWIDSGAGVTDLTWFFSSSSRGILDLAEFDGQIYLGGSFETGYTSPGFMAGRWNGSSWETFGELNGYGEDFGGTFAFNVLVPWGSRLVLAGYFPFVAGHDIENIAAWTGTTFERVADDELGLDRYAYALASAPDGVVVAGNFDEAGTLNTGPIARWDGAVWNAYGALESDRIDGSVLCLEFDGTDLLAGGGITMPDATTASVARWDGVSWSRLGDGSESSAQELIWFDGTLVAAMFDDVREWNGTTWGVLGTGLPVDAGIVALAVYEGQLHAAGGLDYSGYPDVALFRLDGGVWTSLAPTGTHSSGRAGSMTVHEGSLLVAGDIDGVGEIASPGLINWDGISWSAKTTSMASSWVRVVASTSQGLVIGGSFRDLNGNPDIDGFALEDPVHGWVEVEGAPYGVDAVLEEVDGSIWLGGPFSWAGGGRSTGVAVWYPIFGTSVDEPVALRRAGVEVIPNPFNPHTTFRFELAAPGAVDAMIFDQAGRRVRSILSGAWFDAGLQAVSWNGRDDGGAFVSSGVYFVRINAGDQMLHGKMALVR